MNNRCPTLFWPDKVGIYKRKQESKKTRKQELDKESDQEKKKTRSRPRKRKRKKEKNFLFFLVKVVYSFFFLKSFFCKFPPQEGKK